MQATGSFVERALRREPQARVRLFAYGALASLWIPLREGVLVGCEVPLGDSLDLDIEVDGEVLYRGLLGAFGAGDGHIDLPGGEEVSFAIPFGGLLPMAVVEAEELNRVVVNAESIIADTAAKAGADADPRALEQLYQALLSEVVFRVPRGGGDQFDIPLRVLWPGAGLGLTDGASRVYVYGLADGWMISAFRFGYVARSPGMGSVLYADEEL